MKRRRWILGIILLLLSMGTCASADIPIDAKHFPDELFRQGIISSCDQDGDGRLSDAECKEVTSLDLGEINGNNTVASLKGIEFFPNLEDFFIQYATVQDLDLSKNTKLKYIKIWYCTIGKLNISGCQKLESFWCYYTHGVSSLDLSKLKKIKQLDLEGCYDLSSLKLGKNTALEQMTCWATNVRNLDVRGCTSLQYLNCPASLKKLNASGLTKLKDLILDDGGIYEDIDLHGCTALEEFNCHSEYLTNLNVKGCKNLVKVSCRAVEKLNIENCTSLEEFSCVGKLTNLNASGLKNLRVIKCSDNPLASMTLTGCDLLEAIDCSGTALTSLDVSNKLKLTSLNCKNSRLESLNAGGCGALKTLDCSYNKLKNLNVNGCTALQELHCDHNYLPELRIGSIATLKNLYCHGNQIKELNISGSPSLNKLVKNVEARQYCWEVTSEWTINVHHWISDKAELIVDDDVNVTTTGVDVADKPDLNDATVSSIKDQVYTGKAIRPTVKVKYEGTKLAEGTDYTVSYKNNKKIGTATVILTGAGNYAGEKTVTFNIVPAKTSIQSMKPVSYGLSYGFRVKWKKVKNITGYEIEYCTSKDFLGAKRIKVTGASKTEGNVLDVPFETRYYVRIRTYKKTGVTYYYSPWSKTKTVKTPSSDYWTVEH